MRYLHIINRDHLLIVWAKRIFVRAKYISLLLAIALWVQPTYAEPLCTVSPNPTAYQPLTIRCEGVRASEARTTSLNHRMTVTIANDEQTWRVPGYFAADGNAANTGADSGNIWQAHFNPPKEGDYVYGISFKIDDNIAVELDDEGGTPIPPNSESSIFIVAPPDQNAAGFNRTGKLEAVGAQYPRFANGDYFVKGGIGSPETFLAMDGDFDGTPRGYDQMALDNFSAHISDWQDGDPVWSGDAGRGIIGAVNYVADVAQLNSIYMVILSEGGDGNNVFPWPDRVTADSNNLYTYDTSKLDQWRTVFEHAYNKGVHLHLLLSETENDQLFEYYELGETGNEQVATARKLYYRELIARFGHLNITWDLGEEFSHDVPGQHGYPDQLGRGATFTQAGLYADYIDALDPYNTPVVIHTIANMTGQYTPLFGRTTFDGIAIQSAPTNVREQTSYFRDAGRDNDHQWLVSSDEQGGAGDANPCYQTSEELFDERSDVLWGNLMALGWGVEWYGGYETCGNDFTHGDLRVRDMQYKQTGYAVSFFNDNVADRLGEFDILSQFLKGEADNEGRVIGIIGNVYVVYLPDGRPSGILSVPNGAYKQTWFNPRTGDYGSSYDVSGDELFLGYPPDDTDNDWVILVEAIVPIEITVTPAVVVLPGANLGTPTTPRPTEMPVNTAGTFPATNLFDSITHSITRQTTLSENAILNIALTALFIAIIAIVAFVVYITKQSDGDDSDKRLPDEGTAFVYSSTHSGIIQNARKVAAEEAVVERVATEKVVAEEAVVERVTTERVVAEKGLAKRVATEKVVAEEAVAERATTERVVAEEAVAERATTEKVVAEKAVAERGATEKMVAEEGVAERAAAERAAAERPFPIGRATARLYKSLRG